MNTFHIVRLCFVRKKSNNVLIFQMALCLVLAGYMQYILCIISKQNHQGDIIAGTLQDITISILPFLKATIEILAVILSIIKSTTEKKELLDFQHIGFRNKKIIFIKSCEYAIVIGIVFLSSSFILFITSLFLQSKNLNIFDYLLVVKANIIILILSFGCYLIGIWWDKVQ